MLVIAGVVAWKFPSTRGAVKQIIPVLRRRVLRLPDVRVEPQADPEARPPTPVQFGDPDAKGSEGG